VRLGDAVPEATYAEGNLSGGCCRSSIWTLSCNSRRLATARYASMDSTIRNSLPELNFVDSTTYASENRIVGCNIMVSVMLRNSVTQFDQQAMYSGDSR
jgi:hypothetical protein